MTEKLLEIPLLLPGVDHASVQCVARLIAELTGRRVLLQVHVVTQEVPSQAKLCITTILRFFHSLKSANGCRRPGRRSQHALAMSCGKCRASGTPVVLALSASSCTPSQECSKLKPPLQARCGWNSIATSPQKPLYARSSMSNGQPPRQVINMRDTITLTARMTKEAC